MSEFLQQELVRRFRLDIDSVVSAQAFAGCRPCDELSVIGPSSVDHRVLFATGYMGHGLSQGLLAGKSIAELIYYGKSSNLPRLFWPERLRSLES